MTITACSPKEATSELGSKITYAIGDKITFEKSASITITGVAYTDERNQFDDSNPDKVLVVTYNVENLSDKDYYVGSELELYVGGRKMDTYPVANTINTISSGRSFEGASQAFGIIGEGDYELEVEPSISFKVSIYQEVQMPITFKISFFSNSEIIGVICKCKNIGKF